METVVKKKTCSVMALGLTTALALAACGSATTTGSPVGPSDFKACMLSDEGGFSDQSFTQSAKDGLDRAESELGVKAIVTETGSEPDSGYASAIDSLLRQGCRIVIGASAALAEDLTDAAENHPDIDFALIDADFTRDGLSNAKPLLFTVAEAAYLAGYTAAGTTTTGAVGTYGGRATPAVQGFMEGFAQGVARYNADRGGRASATGGADGGTGVELLGWDPADPENGSFVGDFSDVAGSRRIAEQLFAQGAGIIMPVAGNAGRGALTAVASAGGDRGIVWVDADGYEYTDASQYMMTSVIKDIGTAVYDTVNDASSGAFSADPSIGTLENGGVSLAPLHDWDSRVPADVKARVEGLRQQIIDGSLDVSTRYDPS